MNLSNSSSLTRILIDIDFFILGYLPLTIILLCQVWQCQYFVARTSILNVILAFTVSNLLSIQSPKTDT
nr:MAG TPA: hypothetical protein [Caudoviricetes sp.]